MKDGATASVPYPETEDIFTSSDAYASRFAGSAGRWMLSVQERFVLERLREVGPATVLDVGGGHAQLAGPVARTGARVTVLGSDPVCARRLETDLRDGRVGFVAGNVIALPFEDRSFDSVVSVRLLPHCARWPELVREMCRVAKRSVVVDYPTPAGFNALAPMLFGAKRRVEKNTRAWRMFRTAELREEFGRHGFRLHALRRQFFLPMALHRALGRAGLSRFLEAVCRGIGLTAIAGSPVIADFRRAG